MEEITTPPAAPNPPEPTIPWEDTGAAGALTRFVETIKLLATAPGEAFRQMPTVGGVGQPLLFAIIVGLATTHDTTRSKAAVAVILPAVLCCGFLAVLTFMGVLAGLASSR